MSASIIRLIPADPRFVPTASSQEQAVSLLRLLLPPNLDPSSKITAKVMGHVQFVDQGENFERIVCPFCSVELPIRLWHEAMDKAKEENFADLRIATPCCQTDCSLNDLQYEWPAGFAQFIIEIHEPFVLDSEGVFEILELSQNTLDRLQDTLGCRLRIVRTRY